MNFSLIPILVSTLVAGCASSGAAPLVAETPIPSRSRVARAEAVETRHAYLFAPGKAPVLLVSRAAPNSASDDTEGMNSEGSPSSATRSALHDNSLGDPSPTRN